MFPYCSSHSSLFSGLSLQGRGEGKIPCTGPLQVSQGQLLSSTQPFAALPPDPGYLGKHIVSLHYPHQAAHPAVSPPHLNEKPTGCKALMKVFLEGSHLSLLPFPCLFPLLGHVGVMFLAWRLPRNCEVPSATQPRALQLNSPQSSPDIT